MPQTILHLACHPRDRSRLLRRAGYRVVEATTQSDALRLASDANPAAIIVAAEPHSNVAELCERLRAIPLTSAIPVIHVSENGLNGSHPTECSADVCLDEPVKSQALVGVLQSVVCTGAAAPYNQGMPHARRNAAAKVDYPGTGWVESIAGGLTDHSKEFSSLCLEPQQTRAHGGVAPGGRPLSPSSSRVSSTKLTSQAKPWWQSLDTGRLISTLLENVSEAVVVVDGAGIVWSNRRTEEIFGEAAKDCCGKDIGVLDSCDVYTTNGRTRAGGIFARLAEVACGGTEIRNELLFVRSTDTAGCSLLCDALPLVSPSGEIGGGLLVLREIPNDAAPSGERSGDPREKLETLELSNEKLRKANGDLKQFANVVAHDLKSPLGTISALTTWMWEEYGNPEDADAVSYVECLRKAVHRINGLVDSVLEYTRLGVTGRYEAVQVDCAQALAWVIATLHAEIRASGAVITFDALPTIIVGQHHFEALLHHLLSNAIGYRRSGIAPRIHVSVSNTGDEWTFSVRDNGTGIARSDFESIFQPLHRLHSTDKCGSGLGLSVCKSIVELYSGRIWLESELNEGTTFHFSLMQLG